MGMGCAGVARVPRLAPQVFLHAACATPLLPASQLRCGSHSYRTPLEEGMRVQIRVKRSPHPPPSPLRAGHTLFMHARPPPAALSLNGCQATWGATATGTTWRCGGVAAAALAASRQVSGRRTAGGGGTTPPRARRAAATPPHCSSQCAPPTHADDQQDRCSGFGVTHAVLLPPMRQGCCRRRSSVFAA